MSRSTKAKIDAEADKKLGRKGDALLAGAWAGCEARYVAAATDGTVKLSLDIFGRLQLFAFPEALVVPRDTE